MVKKSNIFLVLSLFILILLSSCTDNSQINIRTFNVGLGYYSSDIYLNGPINDAIITQRVIEETIKEYPNTHYKGGYVLTSSKSNNSDVYNIDPSFKSNNAIYIEFTARNDKNKPPFYTNAEINQINQMANDIEYEFWDKLDTVLNLTKKDDILIISLSGHGYFDKSSGITYFVMTNKIVGNYIQNIRVPFKDIFDRIKSKTNGKILLIIDTCLSGNTVGTDPNMHPVDITEKDPTFELYDNIWVISGAKPQENAWEYGFKVENTNKLIWEGLLSNSLAKSLNFNQYKMKFENNPNPSIITTTTLYNKIKSIMSKKGGTPKISGRDTELILAH